MTEWAAAAPQPAAEAAERSVKILLTADPELPVPPLHYGGIERIVDGLARELMRRGHEIGLVANAQSKCPVPRLFPWPGGRSQVMTHSLRNTIALQTAVREFKPDVLHSFSRQLYLAPLLLSSLPKIMSYQRRPGLRQVRMGAFLGGRSLHFTGCSGHICADGRKGGGRWHAIHNFVDTTALPFQPSVPPDAPLVFLSRVEPIKGAHVAIQVALRTGRRLVIAGNRGERGIEKEYWEREIAPWLRPGRIEYVGPVNDVQKAQLLGSAVAMIVPIQWDEPFGIVFAEALASGTPVISCPRGALPEIVRSGIDGYLATSVEEACAAVEQVAFLDRRRCRERAEECFSTPLIVSQYETLYRKMLLAGLP